MIREDVPVDYSGGQVDFSPQFVSSQAFKNILPLIKQEKSKAQGRATDVGVYLYMVHSAKSLYKHMAMGERFKMALLDGRFMEPAWIKAVRDSDEMEVLVDYYRQICKTPGERLYDILVERVQDFITEITSVDPRDKDIDHVELLRKGQQLFEEQKKIEAMIREEGMRKVRANYEPTLFERHPDKR